jgi:hypothetical protein
MLDVDRLAHYLDVSPAIVSKLKQRLCPHGPSISAAVKTRERIDREKLASSYFELINSGVCKNKAEVARRIGKSRAWVSKVMNNPKRIDKGHPRPQSKD